MDLAANEKAVHADFFNGERPPCLPGRVGCTEVLVWLCGGCALPAVAVVCVDFLVRETLEAPSRQ